MVSGRWKSHRPKVLCLQYPKDSHDLSREVQGIWGAEGRGIMDYPRSPEGRMCCSIITAAVRSRGEEGFEAGKHVFGSQLYWLGDCGQVPQPLSTLQKEINIDLAHSRFIIAYYPPLFLVTDTIENSIAAWREKETSQESFPNPSLPIRSSL